MLDWLQKHKYPIVIAVTFILAALCIHFFIQGIHKDHTLDMVKQELQLKEETRQQIIATRAVYQQQIDQQNKIITTLQVRDSLMALQSNQITNRIKTVSQNATQKVKAIDNLNDNDLQHYFDNLPEPNDY